MLENTVLQHKCQVLRYGDQLTCLRITLLCLSDVATMRFLLESVRFRIQLYAFRSLSSGQRIKPRIQLCRTDACLELLVFGGGESKFNLQLFMSNMSVPTLRHSSLQTRTIQRCGGEKRFLTGVPKSFLASRFCLLVVLNQALIS
jgi:hypothetical protein